MVLSAILRVSIPRLISSSWPGFLSSTPRAISTTAVLNAEPPKKKKKVDILIVKMRIERKIRKLEKGIRKLKKTPKQLKPIEEYVLPPQIIKAMDTRTRNEGRPKLELVKVWAAYRQEEGRREKECLARVMAAQDRALKVLKQEAPHLYQQAIQIDSSLFPFTDNNLVTETPPNSEYRPPDGTKTDVSKIWRM